MTSTRQQAGPDLNQKMDIIIAPSTSSVMVLTNLILLEFSNFQILRQMTCNGMQTTLSPSVELS